MNRHSQGSLMMRAYLMAALGSFYHAAPVLDSFVVLVTSHVSVRRGQTTTLPCWLSPPQSAEGMEVRWYRQSYDTPVMLYKAKKFETASQVASYAGRVSFGLKDAASGGLVAGDVSLELVNATLDDNGDYTCYVSSDKDYQTAVVGLSLTEKGSPPRVSVRNQDSMLNLTCESGGWYPKPILRWWKDKQLLTPERLRYSQDSSGLESVHSSLLVPSFSEVTCSVGLSGQEAMEARVHLDVPPETAKQESGSSSAGWVAFAILLIATLAGLGVLYGKMRGKKGKEGSDQAEENQKLLAEGVIQRTDLTEARTHYVNVTLDQESKNPFLTIRGQMLRDNNLRVFPDGQNVTCVTAIKGSPNFSSGQHYWEVSLAKNTVGMKKSWWLGVTSACVIPQEPGFVPTAANGFFFLSSSSDGFRFSTEPNLLLPADPRPQTVGVHVDYDRGELSLYNVERESLLCRLTTKFEGDLFPLFNPGKGERAPMEILHRKIEEGQSDGMGNSHKEPAEGQSDDMGNTVDSTAQ